MAGVNIGSRGVLIIPPGYLKQTLANPPLLPSPALSQLDGDVRSYFIVRGKGQIILTTIAMPRLPLSSSPKVYSLSYCLWFPTQGRRDDHRSSCA